MVRNANSSSSLESSPPSAGNPVQTQHSKSTGKLLKSIDLDHNAIEN
ncbi:uncharacterized protein METZ01_LOCUS240385, partial [marine metagenome]